MKSMLIDTTRCIACRGCQVACKQQHELGAQKTQFFWGDGFQNPPHRSAKTWNLITFNDVQTGQHRTLRIVFVGYGCAKKG